MLTVAGDYQAPDYWKKRADIGAKIKEILEEDMAKAYADVSGFMLLKNDLPNIYEGAIVATEVTN